MLQENFNQIQNNFQKFLTEQLHPSTEIVINKQTIPEKRKIIEIEKTTAFGSEDKEIGYKVQWTGKNGNLITKIY